MTPDPRKIQVWERRAPAYDRLCRSWEIFSRLSIRLIDSLPADLEGAVLDIGGGTGLTSEVLLDRRPRCNTVLIEPSPAMAELAREHLAGRPAQCFVMGLDEAPARGLRAVAAVASASMQFVDLDPTLATLARILPPGGRFAFNLWWHHWEETMDAELRVAWKSVAAAACRDWKLPSPPELATKSTPKSRAELTDASRRHGFDLLVELRDEDAAPIAFDLDFEAMNPDWPATGLTADDRAALVRHMHELARGRVEPLISTRFLLRRSA